MKIEVIIEKSNSGLFAVYTQTDFDGFSPAGYGKSVEEALTDFQVSLNDMNEMRIIDGIPPVSDIKLECHYDIESFFDKFDFLNISKVAEVAGINPSLMRQYATGHAKAGQGQYEKIKHAVSQIASELQSVRF